MNEQCACPQEERIVTGWGFRLANWSPANDPVMIRVHYGCDRPLYGHRRPWFSYARRPKFYYGFDGREIRVPE